MRMYHSEEVRRLAPEMDPLRLGMGWKLEDLEKPKVIIESTFGDSHPGSAHLLKFVDTAAAGVAAAGGRAARYFTTDICDGMAQGHDGINYSLASRDMIANMVEIHNNATPFDAGVFIASCDKGLPGLLMGIGRTDLPAVVVTGGVMEAGPDLLTLEQIGAYSAMCQRGEISEAQLTYYKHHACPSCGACSFMGTAGTMQVMCEALGLTLPGSALLPATSADLVEVARKAGAQAVELAKRGLTARDIVTRESFENAIIVHAAISGSTNAILHLPAIAHEFGIEIDADTFERIHKSAHYLLDVRPAGRWPSEYVYYAGGVPAIAEVQFSLVSNRGCFGGCSFCALTFHQGRIIQTRSHASILQEAEAMTHAPGFKGYIHDVGGPTANFRQPACKKQLQRGACPGRQCLFPAPCKNLIADHSDYLALLRKLRKLPNVKKVFIRSGIRFDYLLADPSDTFFKELVRYHISGQLKVAPEHVSDQVLRVMGKPPHSVYQQFVEKYKKINEQEGMKQYVVPYLMSSHPGCTMQEAVRLAEYLRDINHEPEQVQDFYPTPSTLSTVMYDTGLDPRTMEPVYIPKNPHEKAMQRALMQYRRPQNYFLVREALQKAGRTDLIGFDPKCLIRPYPPKEKKPGAPDAQPARRTAPAKPAKKRPPRR